MFVILFGIFCLLFGISLVLVVLIRKLPVLGEFSAPSPKVKLTIPKIIPLKIDFRAAQRRSFGALEIAMQGLRTALFAFLRISDRLLRLAQKKAGKKNVEMLPQFLFRTKRRKAYLEEEKKLLEWIENHHDDVAAYKRLGNLYSVAGNIDEARTAFQQAFKLAPDDDEIKRRLDELASL